MNTPEDWLKALMKIAYLPHAQGRDNCARCIARMALVWEDEFPADHFVWGGKGKK